MQAQALPTAVRRRVYDLSDEPLIWRRTPRSNHVGFITWHCLRACDMQLGRVRGVGPDGEVWQTDGFTARTGYAPRGLGARGIGIGTGYSLAMVDVVPVTKDLVTAYTDAVAEAYFAHFATMTEADLDAPTLAPPGAAPMLAVNCLEVALRQFYQHMSECDYLRGLIGIPDPRSSQPERHAGCLPVASRVGLVVTQAHGERDIRASARLHRVEVGADAREGVRPPADAARGVRRDDRVVELAQRTGAR